MANKTAQAAKRRADLWIGGKRVPALSGNYFIDRNPEDDSTCAQVAEAGVAAGVSRRVTGQTIPLEIPGRFSMSVCEPLGVIAAIAPFNMHTRTLPDSCFSWAIDCYVGCYAIWDHERDVEQIFSWLDQALPLMDPFAEGHYVNEVEGRRHPDRYRLSFTDENWQRLQELRSRYDPSGVFYSYLGHG